MASKDQRAKMSGKEGDKGAVLNAFLASFVAQW